MVVVEAVVGCVTGYDRTRFIADVHEVVLEVTPLVVL